MGNKSHESLRVSSSALIVYMPILFPYTLLKAVPDFLPTVCGEILLDAPLRMLDK